MSIDSRKFFDEHGHKYVETQAFGRPWGVFRIEDLYQAFKERMLAEAEADGLAECNRVAGMMQGEGDR